MREISKYPTCVKFPQILKNYNLQSTMFIDASEEHAARGTMKHKIFKNIVRRSKPPSFACRDLGAHGWKIRIGVNLEKNASEFLIAQIVPS